MRGLVLACAVAGCGIDMTGAQPWVTVDELAPPLEPDASDAPASRPGGPQTTGSVDVRIVSYNVQYGPDLPAITAALLAHPELAVADVFLVQEIEAYPDEPAPRAATLARALGMGHVYVPARLKEGGTHGLAILSRYPIRNVSKMDLPASRDHQIAHRIAIAADLDIDGRLLHVIDVHLDTKLSARERIAQLYPAVIDAPATSIVAGDFNTAFVQWADGVPVLTSSGASDQARVVDAYLTDLGFDAPTRDSGPTESMFGIEQRLDSIYTRGLDVTFGGVERVGPSDHWPLWLDVHLP